MYLYDECAHESLNLLHVILRCIEQVKNSQYLELSHDLEIDKAIMFLKLKDFQQVCLPVFLCCAVSDQYRGRLSLFCALRAVDII